MSTAAQIAKHFREIYFGGNWTASNYKETLAEISWQQATTKVYNFNTIAVLVFHTNYFVDEVLKVLEGGPLDAHDKFSFDHPAINSKDDWDKMLLKTFTDAEKFAGLVEQLPAELLYETFCDEKYGNYYRNLHGIIEHCHYHLGQIVLLKKIVQQNGQH
ncbi:MAG: DUF1572 domain-containing protein [Chitinophagaceae bacterium]